MVNYIKLLLTYFLSLLIIVNVSHADQQAEKYKASSEFLRNNKSNSPFPPPPPAPIPTISKNYSQSNMKSLDGKATNLDSVYPRVNTLEMYEDKHILQPNFKKVKPEIKLDISKLIANNYNTYVLPKPYYAKNFSKNNSHLPPAYFDSYYTQLAFNAVAKEDLQAIRYFIKTYKMIERRNKIGDNMLLHAVKLGTQKSARILLMNKFSPNSTNITGKTALHLATLNGDYHMVKLLLTMGASVRPLDINNKTAIDYANSEGFDDIASLLNNYSLGTLNNNIKKASHSSFDKKYKSIK